MGQEEKFGYFSNIVYKYHGILIFAKSAIKVVIQTETVIKMAKVRFKKELYLYTYEINAMTIYSKYTNLKIYLN